MSLINWSFIKNKAGYTATPVACRWAGAIIEVSEAFGQEQYGQRINKAGYTATPVACGWAGAIIEVSGAFGQEQ